MEANPRLSAALRHKAPQKPKKRPQKRESVATAVKTGFSLFPTDVAKIEALRDTLHESGRTISASQAVRLALRAVNLDAAALIPLLDAMLTEDGRTIRHAGTVEK